MLRITFLVFGVALVVCDDKPVQEGTHTLYENYSRECMMQSGFNEEGVEKLRGGVFETKPTKEAQTYVLCVLVKNDMMTTDAVLKMDGALARIPEDERERHENILDQCIYDKIPNKERNNKPMIAYKFLNCYSTKAGPNYVVL